MNRKRLEALEKQIKHMAEAGQQVNTNGSLFFQVIGNYERPRCTLWHHAENWETYADDVLDPDNTVWPTTRCPFATPRGAFQTMGCGNDDPPGPTPCSECEWFRIIPKM